MAVIDPLIDDLLASSGSSGAEELGSELLVGSLAFVSSGRQPRYMYYWRIF